MNTKLPGYLQKKAEVELNENQSRIHEDIEHLKSWLAKQPHLHAKDGQFHLRHPVHVRKRMYVLDDHRLLCFLRGTKFSLERAKEKIDLYYTARTLIPEVFSNRDPFLPEIQEILRIG